MLLHQDIPQDIITAARSELSSRNSQPLAALPSYPVAATILSFYDYRADVDKLLQKLSKKTQIYAKAHCEILKQFIILRPPPRLLPYFGQMQPLSKFSKCEEFQWPSREETDSWFTQTQIDSIQLKQEDDSTLHGIQINLSNGAISPYLEGTKLE